MNHTIHRFSVNRSVMNGLFPAIRRSLREQHLEGQRYEDRLVEVFRTMVNIAHDLAQGEVHTTAEGKPALLREVEALMPEAESWLRRHSDFLQPPADIFASDDDPESPEAFDDATLVTEDDSEAPEGYEEHALTKMRRSFYRARREYQGAPDNVEDEDDNEEQQDEDQKGEDDNDDDNEDDAYPLHDEINDCDDGKAICYSKVTDLACRVAFNRIQAIARGDKKLQVDYRRLEDEMLHFLRSEGGAEGEMDWTSHLAEQGVIAAED